MTAYVYILASKKDGVLYVGSARNLRRRVTEHQMNLVPGFTQKYWVKKLVYFEVAETYHVALARERNIKEWRRMWKIELIEKTNPNWNDLCSMID